MVGGCRVLARFGDLVENVGVGLFLRWMVRHDELERLG